MTRFDLMLLERTVSNNVNDQVDAAMYVVAAIAFAALTISFPVKPPMGALGKQGHNGHIYVKNVASIA
jgi:hypothetical protein